MTSAKCPLRLEIESYLRSRLLRVSGIPLNTLTYTQLRLITEGKIAEARRLQPRARHPHASAGDGADPISLIPGEPLDAANLGGLSPLGWST